jgi:hypothetical protein
MRGGNSDAEHGDRESNLHSLCKYLFFLPQHAREPSLELIQAGLLLEAYEVGSGNPQGSVTYSGFMMIKWTIPMLFPSLPEQKSSGEFGWDSI